MASRYSSQGKGSGNGNGDDTDRSLNRRMKKLGKSSKPAFDTETESDESSSSDDGRGERRKYKKANNSRYRSRSTRRARSEAGQGAEPRFSGKFDGNGVLIEASAEREAANMRARIDKEKRYIAEARPHKARSGGGGGGDIKGNDWQIQRGRTNGRGNAGNRREDQPTGKKLTFKASKTYFGATDEGAASRGSNSHGDINAPPTDVARSKNFNRPLAQKKLEEEGSAPSTPENSKDPNSDKDPAKQKLTNHLSETEVVQKSKNPNYAAMMAKARARAEEVVYVFSGLEDQLPLTQTQFEQILIDIQGQALMCQIKGEPAPAFKFTQYSVANDNGFIGVESPDAAELIVQAIKKIKIKGVQFRGWRAAEMKVKHLVTCEIREDLAKNGVPLIVAAMIKINNLKGETLSAWLDSHRMPNMRTFRFFADDELHQELLLRRNGPLGVDQGWNIMLYMGAQHTKAHISQPLQTTVNAVAEAAKLKDTRDRERVAAAEAVAKEAADAAAAGQSNDPTKKTTFSTVDLRLRTDNYFENKKLRKLALAVEEEAAEAERILNAGSNTMDQTNNAKQPDWTPPSNWADDENLTTPPSKET
jgi:hypothetical protein